MGVRGYGTEILVTQTEVKFVARWIDVETVTSQVKPEWDAMTERPVLSLATGRWVLRTDVNIVIQTVIQTVGIYHTDVQTVQ